MAGHESKYWAVEPLSSAIRFCPRGEHRYSNAIKEEPLVKSPSFRATFFVRNEDKHFWDVRSGSLKRVASAVGEGSAVAQAIQWRLDPMRIARSSVKEASCPFFEKEKRT